ncbi:hypothetical protein CRE_29136 [Caenorhabditis remanei]|uniref:Uncharacterized protein n=1 Tax=Caenorhabditis remanei TaxID=31234 RepID=E3N4K2_CAERE|nr:hypothetical protein CRE_29136 [Caenorhabditis remanei]
MAKQNNNGNRQRRLNEDSDDEIVFLKEVRVVYISDSEDDDGDKRIENEDVNDWNEEPVEEEELMEDENVVEEPEVPVEQNRPAPEREAPVLFEDRIIELEVIFGEEPKEEQVEEEEEEEVVEMLEIM